MARGHTFLGLSLVAVCACGRTEVQRNVDTNCDARIVVRPDVIDFPPTFIGEGSRVTAELSSCDVEETFPLVALPPFGVEAPEPTFPRSGNARVDLVFMPIEAGLVTGPLFVMGEGFERVPLAAVLVGEGISRCEAGCNDGDACTVDLCDEERGCFHESVTCPAAPGVCEQAQCHPALGCQTVAVPDGTVCGATTCGGTRVCRAGECVESGSPTRLVGHWTFDEMDGPTVVDASGLGHHGMLVAGTRVPSRRNRGITHTDGSMLVHVADHPDFAFSGSFTVKVWVETPDPIEAGQQMLVFRGDIREGLDPLVFSLQPQGATFLVERPQGPFDVRSVAPSAPVLSRAPVELTGVFDAQALEARLYDGCALVATKCSPFSSAIRELDATWAPGVGLGGHASHGGSIYSFRGVLDEVRMYEGAMSPTEVAASCGE